MPDHIPSLTAVGDTGEHGESDLPGWPRGLHGASLVLAALAGLAGLAVLAAAGWGLWALARAAAAGLAPLAEVITTPVRAYLHAHAGPLPVAAGTLHTAWAGLGLGLAVASWGGSTAARVGWVLIGAATAAMAYLATPAPAQALAAAVTAAAWVALSIPALAARPRPVVRPPHGPPPEPAGEEHTRHG